MNLIQKIQRLQHGLSPSAPPLLMAHIVAGYPNQEESLPIAREILAAGASMIEVQFPFSDPLADGPVITEANEQALQNGMTPPKVIELIRGIREFSEAPIIAVAYANTAYCFPGGIPGFLAALASAGADGIIIPDMPPEEELVAYWTEAKKRGISPIPIVSPLTTPERLHTLGQVAGGGMLYCVARAGTTGVREALPEEIGAYLRRVREHTALPIALGFGIGTRAQIELLQGLTDIVAVGSATIKVIKNAPAGDERLKAVRIFLSELAGELNS